MAWDMEEINPKTSVTKIAMMDWGNRNSAHILWLANFYVILTQARVILEEGTSTEKEKKKCPHQIRMWGIFFSVTDVGAHSSLWVEPPLGWWSWVPQKNQAEQAMMTRTVSSNPPWLLLQFLPLALTLTPRVMDYKVEVWTEINLLKWLLVTVFYLSNWNPTYNEPDLRDVYVPGW